MDNLKYLNFAIKGIESIDTEHFRIRHYISTPAIDRYGDVVNPKGVKEENFRRNPVVFFGHRSRELPIGKSLEITGTEKGVLALTQFDKKSDFAMEIFRLNAEGYLNSWSIGFMPLKQEFRTEKRENGEDYSFNYIDEWELLEYSSVPIPANPECINLELKEVRNDRVRELLMFENMKTIFERQEKEISELREKCVSVDNFNEYKKNIEDLIISLTAKPEKVEDSVNFETLTNLILEADRRGKIGAFREITGRDINL